MSWSAEAYTRFEAERTQPVHDLIARLPAGTRGRVADLGCGPGNSTAALRARYPGAELVAIDSAPDMVRATRARLPGVRVTEADLTVWAEPGFDLLFANASLQWVPDHARLLRRLLGCLAPGGVLAVQIPDHYRDPPHRLMVATARASAFAARLRGAEGALIHHSPRWYLERLTAAGATVTLWKTIYFHILADAHAIVTWFAATALRPFLAPLTLAEQEAFLAQYRQRIVQAFPPRADGTVILRFPRLFLLAERPR